MSLYQIAIFANGANAYADTLRDTIRRDCSDLGVPPKMLSFLDEMTVSARDRKSPTVGVYFGLTLHPVGATPALSDLIKEAAMVVPVVPTLDGFSQFVPMELLAINGIALRKEDAALDSLASVLLEGLGLLRKSRRFFISYRRAETQGIAIQLYELLDAHGFDVFLDSHSIRPGEPFQEVLWHRLADTDVVVLLDSPDFLNSRWTEEELARANSTNLQILQLIWPGSTLASVAAFSKPLILAETDFQVSADLLGATARLCDACLEKIAVEVESLRARALAARHSYLVHEFVSEAASAGFLPHVQPERFISLETKSGKKYITVPTVGVPDAVRYQELEDQISLEPKHHSEIILLYDERGIRDKWMNHLNWLDRQKLPVKSLQVAKAQSWLGGLV
jgi:TIR domain